MKRVGIIGGGAAGLAAAVMIKRQAPELSVLVLEAGDRVGRKLSVTGGGLCNITSPNLSPAAYHGDPELAGRLLGCFGYRQQQEFFSSLGVLFTLDDRGRAYPLSLQAGSVVDALRHEAAELGAELITSCRVESAARREGGFVLASGSGSYRFDAVLVACGGAAGGRLGSLDGYAILKSLGHKIIPTFPSLVQLKTETGLVRQLKGIKVEGKITLTSSLGSRSDRGEILFTDYGLSGPPVLQVSRLAEGEGPLAELDLLPELSLSEVRQHIAFMAKSHPTRPAGELLAGFINKRLSAVLIKSLGVSPAAPAAELTDSFIDRLAETIKALRLTVTGTTGFRDAQVTAGGADTSQFFENLMSKKARGLFAAGEVLNVDGDCGGFNLAFCWASAHAAAKGICAYLREAAEC